MGIISNLPSTVTADVAAILAQLGSDSPGSGARTDVMSYIKLLEDQLGTDNPSTANQTTVMNFLKLLKDSTPLGAILTPTDLVQFIYANSYSLGVSGQSTLIGKFISNRPGTIRIKATMRSSSSIGRYLQILSLKSLEGRKSIVYGGTITSAARLADDDFKITELQAAAIGTTWAAQDSLLTTGGTGQWSDLSDFLDSVGLKLHVGSGTGTIEHSVDVPVEAGVQYFIFGRTTSSSACYLDGLKFCYNESIAMITAG